MEFNEEERKKINRELATVKEEQKNNGNKLYNFEEVSKKILEKIGKEEKNYKLQNSYN